MRKITIATLTVLILGTAQANYTVKIPLEQAQGGSLPSGSIQFKNSEPNENWQPYAPTYTEWVNSGVLYGCTNWSPDANTVTIGQAFTQTATDCKQDQTRNRQNREQETTTLAYRDAGVPLIENQVITTTDTRNSIGAMKNCTYRAFYPERYWSVSANPLIGLRVVYNVLIIDNDNTRDINGEYPISVIYDGKIYSRGAINKIWPSGDVVYEICVEDI